MKKASEMNSLSNKKFTFLNLKILKHNLTNFLGYNFKYLFIDYVELKNSLKIRLTEKRGFGDEFEFLLPLAVIFN